MNADQVQVMSDCASKALSDEWTFPEIVGRLMSAGVERYHADYSRREITYYLTDGASQVVATTHEWCAIPSEFSATMIKSAIRQSQQGEHSYRDFLRKTMEAGCVGYFVQITGRRVIYFGRDGETHVEHFPAAAPLVPIPSVRGLIESAVYVKNLSQSADFYCRIFEFKRLLESERLIALGVAEQQVLLLFALGMTSESTSTPGGIIPPHQGTSGTHFAFSIDATEFAAWQSRLENLGIPIESVVNWPGHAQSLYFRDLDGNLVELITPGFWNLDQVV